MMIMLSPSCAFCIGLKDIGEKREAGWRACFPCGRGLLNGGVDHVDEVSELSKSKFVNFVVWWLVVACKLEVSIGRFAWRCKKNCEMMKKLL